MRIDPDELDSFADEAVEALPVIVTWNGARFNAAAGDLSASEELMVGGVHENYDTVIHVRKRSLPNPYMVRGDKVTLECTSLEKLNNRQFEVTMSVTTYHSPTVAFTLKELP